MEFILGFVIISILLLILGFGFGTIIFGLLAIMFLMIAATAVFFLYLIIRLFFSERAEAVFTHIGRGEKRKYDSAFYETAHGELPNIFPAEVILKDRFYSAEKKVKVRIDVKKKFVYDRNAVLTIYIGEALCILTTVLFIMYI